MRTKRVVADSIFIDTGDLENLYWDLDELVSVCGMVDETYDEENSEHIANIGIVTARQSKQDWRAVLIKPHQRKPCLTFY